MSAQVSSGNDDERNECFYSLEGGGGSLSSPCFCA